MRDTHLNRYCAEFDLRYITRPMTDCERAALILRGGEGRRLTYWRTDKLAAQAFRTTGRRIASEAPERLTDGLGCG